MERAAYASVLLHWCHCLPVVLHAVPHSSQPLEKCELTIQPFRLLRHSISNHWLQHPSLLLWVLLCVYGTVHSHNHPGSPLCIVHHNKHVEQIQHPKVSRLQVPCFRSFRLIRGYPIHSHLPTRWLRLIGTCLCFVGDSHHGSTVYSRWSTLCFSYPWKVLAGEVWYLGEQSPDFPCVCGDSCFGALQCLTSDGEVPTRRWNQLHECCSSYGDGWHLTL